MLRHTSLNSVAWFLLACMLIDSPAIAKNKIASTSLCGDGYLLALSPDHIAALSWQSRDRISLANQIQRQRPQVWDNVEALIATDADMVLFGPGEGSVSKKYVTLSGKDHRSLIWGEDFEAVKSNIRLMGDNERDVANLVRRLARLSARTAERGISPKILYLSRSGGTAGQGTYVDAAITAAGGQNVIEKKGWLTLDPEFLISLKPDLIVTSFFTDGYESIQAKSVRHKVLRHFIDQHPQVDIPGAFWPCAGPYLIEAAEHISEAIDNLP